MIKKLRSFDIALVLIPIILSILSVALIYSLVFSTDNAGLALKQAVFTIVGIAVMFIFSVIDYRSLRSIWWIFYLIAILLLGLVEIIGFAAGGAIRWIDFGFFQLQPSEVAKLSLIISFSAFFTNKNVRYNLKSYIWSLYILIIPLILIVMEPDLGTALVVLFIYFIMLIFLRPPKKHLAVIFTAVTIFALFFTLSVANIYPLSKILRQYQRERVLTFIDTDRDPYGQGYNVQQAQISLGSGGIWGKGLGKGSQSQLKFLPKPHTDFIFAGTGEALGFAGASVVMLLYLYLIIKIFSFSKISCDRFGMFLSAGIGAMIMFQAVINIGMNLGLAPVTGIPLPMLSNGGTSLIITFASIGIVQSVNIYHKKLSF